MWLMTGDVEMLDAEREVDRIDILERARQRTEVRHEKDEAGNGDEQSKSRRHVSGLDRPRECELHRTETHTFVETAESVTLEVERDESKTGGDDGAGDRGGRLRLDRSRHFIHA